MPKAVHPGRVLSEELETRGLSANRLALDLGVPANRITAILAGRRGITADTALRLATYFGNEAQFWMNLQTRHDIAVARQAHGAEIERRVYPPERSSAR